MQQHLALAVAKIFHPSSCECFQRESFTVASKSQTSQGWSWAAVQHSCAASCGCSGVWSLPVTFEMAKRICSLSSVLDLRCYPQNTSSLWKAAQAGNRVLNTKVLLFCWTWLKDFLRLAAIVFPFSCTRSSDSTFFFTVVCCCCVSFLFPMEQNVPWHRVSPCVPAAHCSLLPQVNPVGWNYADRRVKNCAVCLRRLKDKAECVAWSDWGHVFTGKWKVPWSWNAQLGAGRKMLKNPWHKTLWLALFWALL